MATSPPTPATLPPQTLLRGLLCAALLLSGAAEGLGREATPRTPQATQLPQTPQTPQLPQATQTPKGNMKRPGPCKPPRVVVRVSFGQIRGGTPKLRKRVRSTLRRGRKGLKYCFDRAYMRRPNLSQKLGVTLRLRKGVRGAKVSAQHPYAKLKQCIARFGERTLRRLPAPNAKATLRLKIQGKAERTGWSGRCK